ncbi:TonB-dependent receptor [Mucilaginibacter sp.]|uniref:SusC/RagA family TonB-linked outer membrane protein n=1 Tax=Mucilaginibacter sp. TaxID=1882438 RepID=UPI0026385211|nr:TonB-dependent receptor [Mucilaginibacter sp.]MDB5031968.1 TonB-dependent Receptor Plug Domain protein [Mucilaginibacter sp.]
MRKKHIKQYLLLCAFLMLTSIAFAQTAIISGTVLDENNQPLPGASIVVKGSQNGIATDINGNYKLSVTTGSVTIVASFIGYQPLERTLTVAGNVTSDFKLAPDAKSLGEVVVIGYGTAKKSDLTGAIATVTAKDFNQGAVTTPEQLIQGKVAGVSIISNSGAPGSGSTIRIRGGASVNGSNNPLIVIDGVPLDNSRNTDGTSRISGVADPLSLINPNDIESFNILKDASAAAIYGNRASNGVILITTKKGKAGKPVINFSTQFSVATLPKEAPVLSPDQFRAYVRANDTTSNKKYISLLGNANTDWQKQIYQTSYSTDNNLSVSGTTAKDKLPYRVSVGYTDQNGILKTSSLQRYTGAINLSPSLFTDHLKINFNFKGAQVKQRFANEGAIGSAVSFNPTLPVYSGNNNYGGFTQILDPTNTPSGLKSLAPLNPLGLLEQNNNSSTVYRAIVSLGIDYKLHFFPDLHVNVNVSYDATKGSGSDVVPADAASNIDVLQNGNYYNGNYSQYNQTTGNKLFEGFLSYSKDIKAIKSHVDVVAGYSFQDFKATSYNFLSYFSDGTVRATSTFNYPYDIQESQLTSGYARLNYVYDEKYLLTGTIRSDVSTRFAPGIRTGNFPSVAFAWRINREDFLKDNQTLSNLKLRLEYGVTGNQDGIGNYDYLSPYSLSNTTAQYQFGGNYYQMYRPAAYYYGRTWEQTSTANAAFDYGFLNDRITGSLDYYYRKTKNLLATIGQPAGSNFGNQITGNVGNMVDQGLEFSINARIIDTKDISWTANLNATYDQNKITNLTLVTTPSFPGLQVGGIAGGTGQTIQIDQVGYPKNSFYVYQQVYAANGQPLDAVFVDKNKDGLINNQDLYINHSPDPKEYFGFSSDFRYKLWSIGFVTRASFGNYVYNNVASNTGIQRNITNPLGFINNGSSDVLTSGLTGNSSNDLLSDYYIQNASFFRMDNAHIGYNFGKIFKNTGDLRISANVQNVFIITQYKGVDPEITNGIDNNLYPRPRTYVLGVNLSL